MFSQQVPEILGFIHANLKIQSTSVQQILLSVLDMLTVQFPRDVLRSVLTDLPQNDRYQPRQPHTFVPCEEQGSEMVWLPEPRKAAGHPKEQALHPTVLSSAGGQLRAAAANTNHGSPEPPIRLLPEPWCCG